jgi:hypothetical protein
LFSSITNVAHSTEIKLLCNISLVIQFKSGGSEQKSLSEIIEITDYGSHKFILPQSDENLFSVSTLKRQGIISVNDFSDVNKWDINSIVRSKNGSVLDLRYSIDRNTGLLFYRALGEKINETGRGFCEKVTQEKRKF